MKVLVVLLRFFIDVICTNFPSKVCPLKKFRFVNEQNTVTTEAKEGLKIEDRLFFSKVQLSSLGNEVSFSRCVEGSYH